jgi:hypothetical protein
MTFEKPEAGGKRNSKTAWQPLPHHGGDRLVTLAVCPHTTKAIPARDMLFHFDLEIEALLADRADHKRRFCTAKHKRLIKA